MKAGAVISNLSRLNNFLRIFFEIPKMFGRQKFDEKSWELLYSLMDQCFPHSFYTELNVKISKC